MWKHVSRRDKEGVPPSKVQIVTWNIDFQAQWPVERLMAALNHLEVEVFDCRDGEPPPPCCILLQEVHARVLPDLLRNEWVRANFFVTPIDAKKWPSDTFGNVTLVERSIKVLNASLLKFGGSSMRRSAVISDLKLRTPAGGDDIAVRIINTHLESLQQGAEARPFQLRLCADMLKDDKICGGVVAGDMNAISPTDETLAQQNGLRDSWWRTSDHSGNTWGYQGGGDFPKGRLDKILFLPQRGFRVSEPARVGVGVKVERFQVWVSDHYGLTSDLDVMH